MGACNEVRSRRSGSALCVSPVQLLACLYAAVLVLNVQTTHGRKVGKASCMVKWMMAAGINERDARAHEVRIKPFSKWGVDFTQRGLADSLTPLILGRNSKKASSFLQCIRKATPHCRKRSPCLHNGNCTYNHWTNGYECRCPKQYFGQSCATRPSQFHGGLLAKILRSQEKMARSQDVLLQRLTSLEKKSQDLHAVVKPQTTVSSCAKLRKAKGQPMKSGTYTLQGQRQVYCEMELDGGGWTLVWKHSYFQVDRSKVLNMRTFSPKRKACTSLSDGWCNEPKKRLPGASEQMTAAFHNQQVVYAYTGKLNSDLGRTWRGAILIGHRRVVDKCTRYGHSVNIPPEPSDGQTNGMIAGISFDKAVLGYYRSNMETDSNHYRDDRRWGDCYLPAYISSKKILNQMTMAIFIR